MKRSPAPKRKTPLERKRSKPRRSERVRDPEYLRFVRGLPCALAYLDECEGRIEADHAGRRPLGRKCSDREAIPLCSKHHRDRTDYRGFFRGWLYYLMRTWCDHQIVMTQAAERDVREGVIPF